VTYQDPQTGKMEQIDYFEEVDEDDGDVTTASSWGAKREDGAKEEDEETAEEEEPFLDERLLTEEERVELFLVRYQHMVNNHAMEHVSTVRYLRPIFDRIRVLAEALPPLPPQTESDAAAVPAAAPDVAGEDESLNLVGPTMIRRAFERIVTERRARTMAERSHRRIGEGDAAGGGTPTRDVVPPADHHVPLPDDAAADDVMMFDRQLMMVLGELANTGDADRGEAKEDGLSTVREADGDDGEGTDGDGEEGEVLAKKEVPFTFPEFVHAYKTVVSGMTALEDLPVREEGPEEDDEEAGDPPEDHDEEAGDLPVQGYEGHRTYRLRTRERVLRMLRTFSAPDVPREAGEEGAGGGEPAPGAYTMSEMRKLLTVKDRQIVAIVSEHEAEVDDIVEDLKWERRANDEDRKRTNWMILAAVTFLALGATTIWHSGYLVTRSMAQKGGSVELEYEIEHVKREKIDAIFKMAKVEKEKSTLETSLKGKLDKCNSKENMLQDTIKSLITKKGDAEKELQTCTSDVKNSAEELAKTGTKLEKTDASLAKTQTELAAANADLASVRASFAAESSSLVKIRSDYDRLTAGSGNLSAELLSAEADVSRLRHELGDWKARAEEAAAAVRRESAAVGDLRAEMEERHVGFRKQHQKTVIVAVASAAVAAAAPAALGALLAGGSGAKKAAVVGKAALRGGAIAGRWLLRFGAVRDACARIGGALMAVKIAVRHVGPS